MRTVAINCLCTTLAILVGCGHSGPEKVVVQGQVTYQGQPVPNGDVMFYPIEGTTGPASGASIKDGQYVADGRGGVPLGKHRVEIRAYRSGSIGPAGSANDDDWRGRRGGQRQQYLPARFNTDSKLTVTVDSSEAPAVHDFQLQD